jgi:hypothetical protein
VLPMLTIGHPSGCQTARFQPFHRQGQLPFQRWIAHAFSRYTADHRSCSSSASVVASSEPVASTGSASRSR